MVAECKCVARIVAPDPQRGGPDPMFVEGTITVVHEPLDLHARAEAMEKALRMMWDWHGGPSGDLSCVAFRDKWGFADQDDYGEAAMHRGVKAALDGSAQ